ncbi:hypothetical protein PGN04_31370, partial [Klebsiella quasipneumoniae subsp. quasipneumoniae]|uniref:hypothetical protein n=1 Tax=Klebsiella quasipneumoniae TaxID=1463165 RepID=UPI0022F0ED11
VQRDLDFNTKIKEELISLNPTIEVEDYFYNISKESYIELKNIYSETDIIFSNRLHALLYAFESGAYPIAMGNAEQNFKVKYVLEDTLLKDNFIDITVENFTGDEAIKQIINTRNENLTRDINYKMIKISDFIMVE